MPWDEPTSGGTPVEVPDYDQVPYSDDDVAAVLDDSAEDVASGSVAPTPAPAAPVAPVPVAAPAPQPAPEPEPIPAPKPAPVPASPEDIAARSALPPELNSVADMLEKVFGPAVSLSVEKKSDAGSASDTAALSDADSPSDAEAPADPASN